MRCGYMDQEEYQGQYPIDMGGLTSENSLRYQTDVEDVIAKLREVLLGQLRYIDNNGMARFKTDPDGFKMINQKGFKAICAMLKPKLSRVYALTDQDDERATILTKSMGDTLIDMLYQHWDEFEIPSLSIGSAIIDIIVGIVDANVRRGVDGTYLKFLRHTSSSQEVRHITADHQQQQYDAKPLGLQRIPLVGRMFR